MLPFCSFVAIVASYRSFDCIKEKLTKDIEEKGTHSSSTHGRKKKCKKQSAARNLGLFLFKDQ